MTAQKTTANAQPPIASLSISDFGNQHMTRVGMVTYGDRYDGNGEDIVRVEYGALRNVFRADRCNYSYREFWI